LEIDRLTLDACHRAAGVVVVVDVLRAFTTAAFAFDRGAEAIVLVSTAEEAFDLREQDSDFLLIGEINGLPIEGFDLPNSPAAVARTDLGGRRLIQRTTAGTQGVVQASGADHLFAASLCVAGATARHIAALRPKSVTFVETGVRGREGGDDDVACADYIAGMLVGDPLDPKEIRDRVGRSRAARKFTGAESSDFPEADLTHALMIDRYDFAMEVERRGDLLVLKPAGWQDADVSRG
jgi:2-phosphosulfolactate phosphatase